MDLTPLLAVGSNIAQIITGAAAAIIGGNFMYRRFRRRQALEQYLKSERGRPQVPGEPSPDSRSMMHFVAHLAMTEEQILEAAFTSDKVKRWTAQDPETGRANALFLQYDKRNGANRDGSN